jgi:hypothetical protein
MKTIMINTKYGPINLLDNDERSKEEIIEELSELFRATNITILKTSEAAAVIRPSLVSGIVVHDDAIIPTKENTSLIAATIKNEPEELEQNIEDTPEDKEIDIIKDMD